MVETEGMSVFILMVVSTQHQALLEDHQGMEMLQSGLKRTSATTQRFEEFLMTEF